MKKLFFKNDNTFVILLLIFTLLILTGCGADTKESTLEKVQEQGYVTVGFANEKPYAYETIDGELTGEAVEIARVILKNLGINEIRGELTEFGSLIPGLQAGRFDMVTAGMFITPNRAKEVSFANPEYAIGEAIAVKKGNPLNLHSYEDLANHDTAKIAIPGGAIEYDYLIASNMPEDRIITVPDIPAALAALQADRVDAISATGPSIQATLDAANDPNIERVTDFKQPVIDGVSVKGYGATAFRHDSQDFRDAFNAELQKLIDSGELLEIIKPFGFTEQELPGDITLEDLIQ